jgi:hypothetical protein
MRALAHRNRRNTGASWHAAGRQAQSAQPQHARGQPRPPLSLGWVLAVPGATAPAALRGLLACVTRMRRSRSASSPASVHMALMSAPDSSSCRGGASSQALRPPAQVLSAQCLVAGLP